MGEETQLDRVEKMVSQMHKTMFQDNGGECWQSKLNRHERWISILKWCALSIGSILTVVITALIIKSFNGA